MCDSDKNESWLKDLMLVLVGFCLAFFSTWFLQWREDQRHKIAIAGLLRQSVQNELRLSATTRETIYSMTNFQFTTTERLLPEVFDIMHEPSLYLEARASVVNLNAKAMNAIVEFDFALQQARFTRDLCRRYLQSTGGEINWKESNGTVVYLKGLENLTTKGSQLVNVLSEEYPTNGLKIFSSEHHEA